jgi:signal transduction histidine kinase
MYLESIQPHTLEETKSYVIKAAGAANRMRSYLGAVQRSIKDSTHHTTFIIQDEIEHALQLLKFKSRQNNVDLEYGGDEVFLQGNPIRFFQIILNLVSNAIDACAANPNQEKNTHHKVTIRVSNTPSAIILKITDTGIGLPNTDIFERHKTHKNPSEHSGLGLWIVRTSIIDDYKGTITTSSSSQGTCFTITIPHHYSSRQ